MIRQWVKFGRLGVVALGIAAGLSVLSLTEAPVFGSTPAQSQEYERRNGFRCPTVGDCGRSGFRDGNPDRYDRPRYRDRVDDHASWRRNHRRAYDGRDYYDDGPSFSLDLAVPLFRYERPVYVAPRSIYRARGNYGAHTDWCFNRYRSYRSYDNSFQPYGGPRQQCWSPYS